MLRISNTKLWSVKYADLETEAGWRDTVKNVGLTGLMTLAPMMGTGCDDGQCNTPPQQQTVQTQQVQAPPQSNDIMVAQNGGYIVTWVKANESKNQIVTQKRKEMMRNQAQAKAEQQFGKVIFQQDASKTINGENYWSWLFKPATQQDIDAATQTVQQMGSPMIPQP